VAWTWRAERNCIFSAKAETLRLHRGRVIGCLRGRARRCAFCLYSSPCVAVGVILAIRCRISPSSEPAFERALRLARCGWRDAGWWTRLWCCRGLSLSRRAGYRWITCLAFWRTWRAFAVGGYSGRPSCSYFRAFLCRQTSLRFEDRFSCI
jgi:hypothetical protein